MRMTEALPIVIGTGILAALCGGAVVFMVVRLRQSRDDARVALREATQTMAQQIADLSAAFDRRLAQNTDAVAQQLRHATAALTDMQKIVNEQLAANTQRIDKRMDATAQSFARVQALLAKVEESNRQMVEVSKDVASLQEILTAPKLRGGFGELMLGDLLASMLPAERYTLQHTFRSGEVVDAFITLRDGLGVSVDAKFPLENFKRVLAAADDAQERARVRRAFVSDVKKHVQAIAKKYIVPEEGTMEFALMYIPAENVYYETIVSDKSGHELLAYFFKHRVIPVSPNSFYAYLMTIVFGLRGMQIEKRAQAMLGAIDRLGREHAKFAEEFDVLGRHLGNAQKRYEDAHRRFGRIEAQVERITTAQHALSATGAATNDDNRDDNA